MPLAPFSPHFEDAAPVLDATPPLAANHSVGLRHFHALDPTRDDVSTQKRQFMVSVFYPALKDDAAPRARLTDILAPQCDAALALLAQESQLALDEKTALFTRLQSLTLRAQRNLIPNVDSPCPILIYYPGGTSHRLSNAALCERLASAGYIVFTLDAPRDAPVVVFPNGQLVPFVPNSDEDYIWPRVADVRFLLDQLNDLNTNGALAGRLDLSRIGMFGHSRGGYLANICAVEDARIGAAVNMDGFLWGLWMEGTGLSEYPPEFQARARALTTPILRLRGDQGSTETVKRGFDEEVKDFGGDFIFASLDGYEHGSFATIPWLNGTSQNFAQNALQPVPPLERTQLLTELLADFFDTYLLQRHSHMALLASPYAVMDVFSRCQI